jgi:class 3 adenylate cyclase
MRLDLPTGTFTFLFTDVEGSTRLLHELGAEAYADALAEHRRLIREACASHRGVEVDTQGDAFFLAFPSAPGALAAAQTITEGLASGSIRLRIGLHTGRASSFVGRERELGELLSRIEAGSRLLTLTGPGGSGKTRLALEAAASLVPAYKAGVFWVGSPPSATRRSSPRRSPRRSAPRTA